MELSPTVPFTQTNPGFWSWGDWPPQHGGLRPHFEKSEELRAQFPVQADILGDEIDGSEPQFPDQ